MSEINETAQSSKTLPFSFTGKGDEFFKIWIVNVVLTILTLGIYAAWAKVRTRRYFYGNTFFDDANFDYHAKPLAILIGKIIAISVLVIYVLVTEFFPVFGGLILIPIALLTPWAIWRSFQFNARMTSYRNVRFSFVGSLKEAYKSLFLIPFLPLIVGAVIAGIVVLAGLATAMEAFPSAIGLSFLVMFLMTPYIQKLVTAYNINNHQYGQGQFSADLEGAKFYKIYIQFLAWSMLFYTILVIIIFLLMTVFTEAISAEGIDMEAVGSGELAVPNIAAVITLFVMYAIFIIGGIWFKAFLKARLRNYVYSETSVSNVATLKSQVSISRLFKIMLVNTVLLIFTLGLAYPWTKIRIARYMAESTEAEVTGDLGQFVSQAQQQQSALGDELGEAFDMDMGVGI